MLQSLINRNPTMKRLQDEGFCLELRAGYLLVHDVPYVSAGREIKRGTLVSKLTLSGNTVLKPEDHVMRFIGEQPHNHDGSVLEGAQISDAKERLGEGLVIDRTFSCKPRGEGYPDQYQKVITYVRTLSSQAQMLDAKAKAQTFRPIRPAESTDVFRYLDTNSSRADINDLSERLQNQRIAIIGLGGSGSYVLDFVAKTRVKEIHLFDGDVFLTHNAFRAPGAPSFDALDRCPKKVAYFEGIYSQMHRGIVLHEQYVTEESLSATPRMDFAFVAMDRGGDKREILAWLAKNETPFIDLGIGVNVIDGKLTGSARCTFGTPAKSDHLANRISTGDVPVNDYAQNIQIAELNALSAVMAVIRWKKYFGFYHDLEHEHNTIYSIGMNKLINDDIKN
jgi:hypothetical protein